MLNLLANITIFNIKNFQMIKIKKISPFSLNKNQKKNFLIKKFKHLISFHKNNCTSYRNFLNAQQFSLKKIKKIEDIPFLPVNLFKEYELKSIKKKKIFKILNSSGTSGQKVSKIFLDRETSLMQTKVLTKIMENYIGNKRLPMIIIDNKNVLKNREAFSARGAGILGFSIFGKEKIYLFNEKMQIDNLILKEFLNKNKNNRILLFGFTYMIWEYFINYLKKNKIKINLKNSILIHGGGWKKIENKNISKEVFKKELKKFTAISEVYDYYGMVEQTGSIFFECKHGYFHTSIFSDLIVRNPKDFTVCKLNQKGIIQSLSILPKSYPGHSILTEDEGIMIGEDDCKCGRKGKYFKILGRVKYSETRGCSDTYESI